MAPAGHRGTEAIQISGVFTGLAFVVVCLRLYTRFFIVRCPGLEDYFVALAMTCSLGLTICIGIQVEYGMGRHIATLSPQEFRSSLKAFWASLIVYYLSLGLTKTSILLQYRRVFPTKSFQLACWATMALVVAYTVWAVSGSIFACVPVRAFWTLEKATCINQKIMWFTNAGINILTDLLIIILPMPVIRPLNLAKRQKQALIGIFAVGGFVCIVSILRLQSLVAISNSKDATYDNPPAATWSSVETNIGIICSCLPCLRPLVACCLPGVFSSAANKYGAASSAHPRNRSAYGRHTGRSATVHGGLEMKPSRSSSDGGAQGLHDDRIQVVTEVHVKVEKTERERDHHRDSKARFSKGREIELERGSSTETLVRDVRTAI